MQFITPGIGWGIKKNKIGSKKIQNPLGCGNNPVRFFFCTGAALVRRGCAGLAAVKLWLWHLPCKMILHLSQKVTLQLYQVLHLLRKATLRFRRLQVLILPLEMALALGDAIQLHQILHLPQKRHSNVTKYCTRHEKVTLQLPQILRLPQKRAF